MNQFTEQSVIGGLLNNPKKFDDVVEILSESDFVGKSCGIAFSAMVRIANRGEAIDVITVAEEIGQDLDELGGIGYLSEVAGKTPSAANVAAYAQVVKNFSDKARLLDQLRETIERVAETENYEDAQTLVTSMLDTVEPEDRDYVPYGKLLQNRIMDLDRRFRNGGGIEGLLTGFRDLDQLFMGLAPGDLWIFGGRPSMGKTAFALNVIENAARQFGPVLVFSLEMSREQLADRTIVSAAGINGRAYRTAELKEDDWPKLATGVQRNKDLDIHIVDKPAIDVVHATNIAKKFNRKKQLSLIVIDYLQLMRFQNASGVELTEEVSKRLKAMAKLIGCPVMALSQLNRAVEQRPNKRPCNADLRNSGQIEQDADLITFIYRDEYYNEDSQEKGIVELITTKVRNGDTGTVKLHAILAKMQFKDIDFTTWQPEEVKPEPRGYTPYKDN